ncbi:MAG: AAA domain-containing protein, partial [Planctomycetota bacterium]
EGALANEPELRGFDPHLHLKRIEAFQKEDVEQLDLAVLRVRREHAERATKVMNAFPEEERTLKAQIHRKRGGLHVRQLLAAAPNVLLSLRPCWMMSPLSVTQFVDLEAVRFDCIVFDEASQLLPEDVVPALLRADQAIVAGDSRQLPPTPFFRHVGEEEDDTDEPTPVAGYESILEQVSTFLPSCWLSWHYRSRDESLIAFSNHHIYEKRLLTFPDPRLEEEYGIQHVLLTDAVYASGSRRGNPREVEEVVARMLDHARRRPDESLGVIALGIQHQQAIQERLEAALEREENADVVPYFAEEASEPVFVKNLESVQGDERDAIVLSVGYGPDAEGKVALHFGPLNMEGGERRLNVAITRGRKRMTLVTSFPPTALAAERSSSAGLRLLREYIEYAASRGRVLGGAAMSSANPPERSVEMDVYEELVRAGHAPVCRMGASAYRIDLAVPYPTNPGLYAIGVECDGPSYHGSPTARDRDRLRQEVLEQLGWRLHRVWSTSWVR